MHDKGGGDRDIVIQAGDDERETGIARRALTSSCWMTLSCFCWIASRVASTMMGIVSSTSASGPCFISPARMPSLCIRATSFTCTAANVSPLQETINENMRDEKSTLWSTSGSEKRNWSICVPTTLESQKPVYYAMFGPYD